MAAKPIKHLKHVPQRTCVGCREVNTKRELVRIVRTPDGVMIDSSGKLSGRGAYLHRQASCWQRGLKGALARALKTEFTESDQERLNAFLVNLPEEPEEVPLKTDGFSPEVKSEIP